MKKILFISILMILFGLNLFAQEESANCPTVDVSSGVGVPQPGELVSFTANIDTKERTDLQIEYIWTVSSGKIIYGQGTPTITIEPDSDQNITATVEVKGFPEGCSTTSSDNLGCGLRNPEPVKIGEFFNFNTPTEKAQLEELKNKILANPNAQIYVIGRFKKNTSEQKMSQKLKKIGAILMKKFSLDAARITMVIASADQEYSEIWIVPPGANNPDIR